MNIKELIAKNSFPELAEQAGMVYQVWEDGEITLQKSGDILWQRTLHCIGVGRVEKKIPLDMFPEENMKNGHAYIFTTDEGARIVRDAIFDN